MLDLKSIIKKLEFNKMNNLNLKITINFNSFRKIHIHKIKFTKLTLLKDKIRVLFFFLIFNVLLKHVKNQDFKRKKVNNNICKIF